MPSKEQHLQWEMEAMSNLEKHAEEEMRRAGLYDADADYGGMIPEAVMKMIRAHSSEGHSGGSHGMTMAIFNRVVNFKPLTPLTDDPNEWTQVSPDMSPPGETVWQSRRSSSCFSNDGGKTYYDIDEKAPEGVFRMMRRTQPHKE